MKRKFTKDQIQKMFLSGLLMIGLLYGYSEYLLADLNRREKAATAALKDIDTKIGTAGSRLKRLKSMEEQSQAATETAATVNALIPEGEPIAWFPPRMKAFFDRHNIRDAVTRLERKEKPAEPELVANYSSFQWNMELPSVGFTPLGIALAGLENEEQLLEINHVQISTQPATPEFQRVTLNCATLMR